MIEVRSAFNIHTMYHSYTGLGGYILSLHALVPAWYGGLHLIRTKWLSGTELAQAGDDGNGETQAHMYI